MLKKQALAFGTPLTDAMREMFHSNYWTRCGKHWIDVPLSPEAFAKENILVGLSRAEKANYGGSIMQFDILVQSLDTAYVTAAFNITKIKDVIFKVLKSTDIHNEYVDFSDNSVVIVVQSGGYWFHVKIIHKF